MPPEDALPRANSQAGVDRKKHWGHVFGVEDAGKRLAAWRDRQKPKPISYRAAAKLFGCAPSQVCRFEDRTRTPSLEVAFHIQDETGIPARAWLE